MAMNRHHWIAIVVLSAAVRGTVLGLWASRYPWGDGLFYGVIAEQWFRFGVAHDYLLLFPPGYSASALLFRTVFEIAGALTAVGFLCGTFLPLVVYAVAVRLTTAREALWAGLWCAVSPLLSGLSAEYLADAQFILLVWLLILLAMRMSQRAAPASSAAFGLLSGFAFLTKPEALALVGCLGLAIAHAIYHHLPTAKEKRIATAGLVAAAVLATLVSAPYLIWLHNRTGNWMLSGKAPLNVMHAEAKQETDSHRRELQRVYSSAFRLTEDGRLAFLAESPSLLQILKNDPSASLGVYRRNWSVTRSRWSWRTGVLIASAVLGACELYRRRRVRRRLFPWMIAGTPVVLLLLPPIFVSMLQPSFHPDRMFGPALPFWIMLGSVGLGFLSRRLPWKSAKQARVAVATLVAIPLMLALLTVSLLDARQLNTRTRDAAKSLQHRTDVLGNWIEANLPPDATIASTSLTDELTLGRRSVWLPYESNADRLERYLIDRDVTAVISDSGGGVYSMGFFGMTPDRYRLEKRYPGLGPVSIFRLRDGVE